MILEPFNIVLEFFSSLHVTRVDAKLGDVSTTISYQVQVCVW